MYKLGQNHILTKNEHFQNVFHLKQKLQKILIKNKIVDVYAHALSDHFSQKKTHLLNITK